MEIKNLRELFLILKDRVNNISDLNMSQPVKNKRIFDSMKF